MTTATLRRITRNRRVLLALELCGRCSGTGVNQGKICTACGGSGARRS